MNKQLKARIIERFGSQADFAERVMVDESKVSRIIRGRRSLSPEDVRRWSKALGCDPSLLEQRQ